MMEKDRPPGRARRRFTPEFKADAVALVLVGDRPVAHVVPIIAEVDAAVAAMR